MGFEKKIGEPRALRGLPADFKIEVFLIYISMIYSLVKNDSSSNSFVSVSAKKWW